MEKEAMVALVCLGFFAMIVLSIYFIMKFRAVTPSRSAHENLEPKRKSDWQKPGIVVIGVGMGVLISGLMDDYNYYNNDAINVGIVAVCAVISMIVANVLDKRKSTEE